MTEPDLLGDAWSEFLPRSHREALSNAFDTLCDGFFDELTDVPFADTYLGSLLPVGFRHHYTNGVGSVSRVVGHRLETLELIRAGP